MREAGQQLVQFRQFTCWRGLVRGQGAQPVLAHAPLISSAVCGGMSSSESRDCSVGRSWALSPTTAHVRSELGGRPKRAHLWVVCGQRRRDSSLLQPLRFLRSSEW